MQEFLTKTNHEYKTACSVACKVSDDTGEPYKEKYKAKELFEQLLTATSHFEQFDQLERLSVLNALFHYEIGVICLDTEEPTAGEQHLMTALIFLDGYTDTAKYSLLPLNIYNQLGILWSVRKELEKAMEFLKKAESLYNKVVSQFEFPLTFLSLFSLDDLGPDPEGERELNKAYAHTLYYLAQVYGYLEDAEQAAMYCYKTLKWQIDHKLSFNPMEWTLNSAILSQYFATKDQFSIARHLLACASVNLHESTEKEDSSDDTYQRTKADVQRCWGKYGLSLLSNSKQRLVTSADNNSELPKGPANQKDRYVLLECDLSRWEDLVMDEYILCYSDARGVFLRAQKCFNNAKEYYTMNEYASDYVLIVQNISELYKVLAFFEPSVERACKMYKRRADLLEETLNALNIKYYQNTCRELRFELANIYSEMMDMKLSLKGNEVDRKAAEKINMLVDKSIHHFSEFISTLEENKILPVRFADDLVRPTLLAHFYIARLYSKLIFNEPERQLENLKSSDRYYKFVSDYVKKNPDHEHYVKEELQVVTEMLNLLPQRMQMLNINVL